jgi:hypothetical protein
MNFPATDTDWPSNYFNYFTEIEEHFQRARGTGLFLLSPLDWALIESWKSSDVPLDAVLQGIDIAFEKWRSRKIRKRSVNSLAYCAQAVAECARRAPDSTQPHATALQSPFSEEELKKHLAECSTAIRSSRQETVFLEIASTLETLPLANIEELERRLSALEDKLVAAARTLQTDEDLYAIRESLDRELRPYRGKMTADQIAMLERRYLDAAILERTTLPRLSLFYLR